MDRKYKFDGIVIEVPENAFRDLGLWVVTKAPEYIRRSAAAVVATARALAPKRSRDMAEGIVVNPGIEHSSVMGKIVLDVWMDPMKNDIFVKYSKSGKRYYYPASQEYGFEKVNNRGTVPGQYFMKTSGVTNYGTHDAIVNQAVDDMLQEVSQTDV